MQQPKAYSAPAPLTPSRVARFRPLHISSLEAASLKRSAAIHALMTSQPRPWWKFWG